MDTLVVLKALSNETRYNILQWFKDPDKNFEPQINLPRNSDFKGICVSSIRKKTGLAQSVISGHLVHLQQAGLLESKHISQWTYYRRNEENIKRFKEQLQLDL
ncbi:helix-turn-helix transcriptional regulator [Priestia megaterium]|uniref:ArsR/SmtB family transcription factor n=1 Tax=Priestia megaterium TaxID=1404 RepID=UPI0015DC7138|nr:helix-turn-helix transcriptional regulator [Priestia megaterium]QLK09320.1 Transcriptional regulator, ArsR family [Priestia megaterium]